MFALEKAFIRQRSSGSGGYTYGRKTHYKEAATRYLHQAERSPGTIENYLRHAEAFACWLDHRPVTKELASRWKEHLLKEGYAPVSINAMLAAINGLFSFLGWEGYKVKFLKIQRKTFREPARELTRPEYNRLLKAAQSQGRERLALLMADVLGHCSIETTRIYLAASGTEHVRQLERLGLVS